MKRSTRQSRRKFLGSGLNKEQRSTLDLWQEHMAALKRASQAGLSEKFKNTAMTEQSIESGHRPTRPM